MINYDVINRFQRIYHDTKNNNQSVQNALTKSFSLAGKYFSTEMDGLSLSIEVRDDLLNTNDSDYYGLKNLNTDISNYYWKLPPLTYSDCECAGVDVKKSCPQVPTKKDVKALVDNFIDYMKTGEI